jgi:hypothetical protein
MLAYFKGQVHNLYLIRQKRRDIPRSKIRKHKKSPHKASFFYVWSERRDSNPRPPHPQYGALPGCATLRHPKGYPLGKEGHNT